MILRPRIALLRFVPVRFPGELRRGVLLKVGVAGSALTRWTFRAIGEACILRNLVVVGYVKQ